MQSTPERPTVIVADDHAQVHRRIRRVLEPEFLVVCDVFDGEALMTEAKKLCPDLMVVDIFMPRLDGIEAVRRILSAWPSCIRRPKVVFLSTDDGPMNVERAMGAGGSAFVGKAQAAELLAPAARAALLQPMRAEGSG